MDTAGVARMNLFMHNLTDFRVEIGDTLKEPRFKKPDGSMATFDVIVANPPYSLKWKPWVEDRRAFGGVAPQTSADWAFVQHMIASMDPKKGRAGVVLPHGVLFRGGQEAAIRQRVLDDDLLEAVIGLPANLFYSTSIPTCILVFRAHGTKAEGRRDGVLFIDASRRFTKAKNRNILTKTDIADVVTAYHARFGSDADPGQWRWSARGALRPRHGDRPERIRPEHRQVYQAGRRRSRGPGNSHRRLQPRARRAANRRGTHARRARLRRDRGLR